MNTLFIATSTVDILGTGMSLWLALYLLARGFPSRVTIRAVIVLLALSVFFLSASVNLYLQIPGTTTIRAIMLTTALAAWCDLTPKVISPNTQVKRDWIAVGIYVFAAITAFLLFDIRDAFIQEKTNLLYVGRMNLGYHYTMYAIYLWCVALSILYGLKLKREIRVGNVNIYFVIASLLAVGEIAYGSFSLALTSPAPRIVQDVMIAAAVLFLGISIARHQILVERHAALHDMPIHVLVAFVLAAFYAFIAWIWSHSMVAIILMIGLAILTHSLYVLVNEILRAMADKRESIYRQQLRRLEKEQPPEIPLETRLENGLKLLCKILGTNGGFIATRNMEKFIVSTSFQSMNLNAVLPPIQVNSENDVCAPPETLAEKIAWLAPVFKDNDCLALVGIGHPLNKHHYSADDLDLLAEAAVRVGSMLALRKISTQESDPRLSLESESAQLISTLSSNPDSKFLKLVEYGLRNLYDVVALGQSTLADELQIAAATHIDRGKSLREELVDAIESLRPIGHRPKASLSREWESYIILHDTYVEDTPNREVMTRLHISEGTFNRSRRKALRGAARYLLEKPR
jgi:hypothetical protein